MSEDPCLRFLIVDDDPTFLKEMTPRLRRFLGECEITTALNGLEAAEVMAAQPDGFDVALIDQVLNPPPDGIEVMQVLHEIYPHMPVIIMTGWGLGGGLEALRAGAYRYIAKGFNVEELAYMLRAAAEHQRLMRQSWMARVLDTSNALQSSMELDEVLRTILTGIRDLGYDRVRLYLLSADGQTLVGRMQMGGEQDILGLPLPLSDDDCSRETLKSGKPRIYRAEPGRRVLYVDVLEKGDVAEWADIPLIARGQPIGKISADNKYSRRRVLGSELEPLTVLANQAANAIYNARNYEQTQAALANLRRIYQASGRIAASLDPDETLQLIISNAVEATQGVAASLSLIDAGGKEQRRATVNFTEEMKAATGVRPDGYSRRVIKTGRHIAMPDVADVPDVNPGILAFGFRANICLPLLVERHAIGVMWVNYAQPRDFPDDEVQLLQAFANQAAVAIEHARLHAETRRQVAHLDALNRVGQTLVSSLEIEQAPRLLMQEVARLLNLEAGSVMLVDGDDLVIRAAVGPLADQVQGQRFPIGQGIAGRAVSTGEAQLVTDAQNDPDFYPGVDEATGFVTRSLLAVPLEAQGRIIGVIEAVNKVSGHFTPLDRQVLLSLAPTASSALDNARLYGAAQTCSLGLQQHARNLSAVQQVCAEISSLLSRRKIAELVCRRVVELFEVDHSGFVGFDGDYTFGTVIADHPARELIGRHIQLRGIPIEEKLIESRQPQLIEDVAGEEALGALRDRLLEPGIQSILIVPLVVGERVIGSFSLDAIGRTVQFTPETVDLCRIIAAQAALAIENARLFDDEQARARRWQRVANAATEVTQSLSGPPRQLLGIIARAACVIVGANCAVIYPYNAQTHRFDLDNVASFGLLNPQRQVSDKPRSGEGWAVRILREGLEVVNDLEQDAPLVARVGRFFTDEKVRAFVGLRLGTQKDPVGLLYVSFRQVHSWTDDEIEAIQPYAAQAALAIKHAVFQGQLLERTQRDQQRLATVVTLSQQFGSSLEIDQVVDSLLCSLGEPFPQAHSRAVEFYDPERGELAIHPALYRYYWDEHRAPRIRHPIPSAHSISGWVATHRVPANVADVRKDPRYYRLVEDTRSQLTVPIEFAGELIGVLTLESRDIGAFTDEDVQLLQALADQAGVAIQNARTFERLKETEINLRTRTAMLWTTKAGFMWFHHIRGAGGAIRDWALLAREKLRARGQLDIVATEMDEIEAEAADIVERIPSRILLSGEESPAPIRVNDLLRQVVGESGEQQGRSEVQVHWRLQLADTASVSADARWLAEALVILVDNALREMTGGGRLAVATTARDGRVEIRIGDTGPGIPPAVRPKLFKEPIAPAEGGKGSGQGLLWTKAILEGYGGDIRVEKTGPRGTTFLITLPEFSAHTGNRH